MVKNKKNKQTNKKKKQGKEISEFDDLETVDYNNNTSVSDLVNLKKNNRGTQVAAKKIIKKYRNVARKKPY